MPQTRDIALEQLTAAGDALPVAETRVDAAHTIGDALVRKPVLAEMPVAEAIADLVRVEGAVQLQSQADQLAAHLRRRQQELDHREAQLNSRLADFEKELREARLWLAERNQDLNEREARLDTGHLPEGDAANKKESQEAPTAHDLVAPPLPLSPSPSLSVSEADRFERRDSRAYSGIGPDHRQAALELFQEKVSQMHREALELRLAAEEAQAELRASLGTESADDAVAVARERLAQYFRDEVAELTRKRDELEFLKIDLAGEYDRLRRCYDELTQRTASNGLDSTNPNPLLTDHSPLTITRF